MEKFEWRNTSLKPTIAGFVDGIVLVPFVIWCFNITSLPRLIALVGTTVLFIVLKRYGYTSVTIFRYFRSRFSRFLGGGTRPLVRGHEMRRSIDKSHF